MDKTSTLDAPVAEAPAETEKPEQGREPIWERIQKRMQSVPPEELEQLPADGAAEHDHYLYGTPKRKIA